MISKIIPKYDEDERELAVLEVSWADCHRGIRTGYRVRQKPDGILNFRAGSLIQVSSEFSRLKSEFDGGDNSALIRAVEYSAIENVPMPYWVGDAFQAVISLVRQTETDLHTQFGFEKLYPKDGKKSRTNRKNEETKIKLYVAAKTMIADGVGKTAAITKASADLHIGLRRAKDWYAEIDERQNAALDAWRTDRKVHKI
jgi:hypothetical protein